MSGSRRLNFHLLHAYAALFQRAPLVLLGKGAEDDDIVLRGFHHARVQRQAQSRVENDAQQTPPPRQAAAVGEQRIIGNDRTDADQIASEAWRMSCTGGAQLRP